MIRTSAIWLALISPCVFVGCQAQTQPARDGSPASSDSAIDAVPTGPNFFEEVTAQSGIQFSYRNGEEVLHLAILESLGGGAAVIDYNGDGRADLYIPGGGYYAGPDQKQIIGHAGRLYRNDGDWKFTDVTAQVGLETLANGAGWFFSHAAAVGDYDRDGWPDLLVTGWGRIALFHNEPDGQGGRKFVDVSAAAGLDMGVTWATSAAWADFDGDGFSDLFVCQYVDWSFDNNPTCNYDGTTADVCPPKKFKGLTSRVYHNLGNGTFNEVGEAAGIKKGGEHASKALGVLVVDVNTDGRPDVYVANDTVANFLYVNRSTPGTIRFEEQGLRTGVAFDANGSPNGSMGLDAGDPEGVGRPALWVTNYENEFHAFYRNHSTDKNIAFVFATPSSGLGSIGQKFVGWGTGFADFDHDGWEDIFIANGHAIRFPAAAPRRQKPVLFQNTNGKFQDVTAQGGEYFQQLHLSRGMVLADFDNDGKTDVAVVNTNEPVAMLRNVYPTENRTWVGVDLIGQDRRDVVGARVLVESGGRTQTRFQKGGGSYASSPDRRHIFGLGPNGTVSKLTVVWPDGTRQEWLDVPTGKYHVLIQGQAELATERPRR